MTKRLSSMSKKEPTDRQLVMWWVHDALKGYQALFPSSWVSVQNIINNAPAFKVEIREKRARRLKSLIFKEADTLLALYEKRARVLLLPIIRTPKGEVL